MLPHPEEQSLPHENLWLELRLVSAVGLSWGKDCLSPWTLLSLLEKDTPTPSPHPSSPRNCMVGAPVGLAHFSVLYLSSQLSFHKTTRVHILGFQSFFSFISNRLHPFSYRFFFFIFYYTPQNFSQTPHTFPSTQLPSKPGHRKSTVILSFYLEVLNYALYVCSMTKL